MGEICNELTG
jgi:hypothetical protein